jgi:predicted RecA/RadA family phage recombinase
MAEYLPLKAPGQSISMTASAAITGGQLVRVSGSGTVAPTSAACGRLAGCRGR